MQAIVYMDANEVFHGARSLNLEIDYAGLREYVGKFVDLSDYDIGFRFYTGVTNDDDDRKRGFLHWMKANGFLVIERQLRFDPSTNNYKGVNFSAEIAFDMATAVEKGTETVVIMAGASSFSYPMAELSKRGIRTIVAAFHSSLSQDLRGACYEFLDLESEDAIKVIAKEPEAYRPKTARDSDD